MSAFTPSTESPTTIDTLEKTIVHASLMFDSLHRNSQYQESYNAPLENICSLSISPAADGSIVMIARISVALDPAYVTPAPGTALWDYALPRSSAPVAATFKA